MPNESAGGPPPLLPPDLAADFERFRSTLAGAPAEVQGLLSRPGTMDAWREYGRLLHAKAADLALISRNDRAAVFSRHILDSLNPLSLFRDPPDSALDVGSGAGLPGIPLAIAWPSTRVVLVESRERKAGFLEQAARSLRLSNVRVVCARLEDHGKTWREGPCSAIFVRALGDLEHILAHAALAASPDARWVYFLGSRARDEVLPGPLGAGAEVTPGEFGGRLLTGLISERRTEK